MRPQWITFSDRVMLLFLACFALACAAPATFSIKCNESTPPDGNYVSGVDTVATCSVTNGIVSGAVATALFDASINETGWFDFRVSVQSTDVTPQLGRYAAGFLEGFVTAAGICDFSFDLAAVSFGTNETLRALTAQFLRDNVDWVVSQVRSNSSAYWLEMAAVVSMQQGVFDGVAASGFVCSPALTLEDIFIINSQGDLGDIAQAVDAVRRPDWFSMDKAAVRRTAMRMSHCSFMARFLPDMSDVLVSHATWFMYSNMLRTFKAYTFPDPVVAGG